MNPRSKVGLLLLSVLLATLLFVLLKGSPKSVSGNFGTTDPAAVPFSFRNVLAHPSAGSTTSNIPPPVTTTTNATVLSPLSSNTNQTSPPGPMVDDGQLSPAVLEQISALEAEKIALTPGQQKLDTQLLYADKMRRGEPIAKGVPTQRVNLDQDAQGRVLVDVQADVSDALLAYIESLGGKVINHFPQYHAIRAAMPLGGLKDLATRTEVKFVKPATRAFTSAVDSEGDATHQAATARSTFGVDGTGIKIGVLSDSVDHLSGSQIDGLVTVIPGQGGPAATGEGTAMLEIVHDLAPGAQLYFASAYNSEASFADNIVQLYNAGCNVIIDDVLYLDEPAFQDGIVAQAVDNVTTNGVLFFSAAANGGGKDAGTSGTWEGDFVDGGASKSGQIESGRLHAFVAGTNYNVCSGISEGGPQVDVELFWSDPLGASANDYDLYVLNSSGTSVVASSLNIQNGTQDPIEGLTSLAAGDRIVIVKFSGSARFLHLSTLQGMLRISTAGSTRGHNCATNAFGVAATDANNSYPSPFTGGAANPVESFSSDGPRHMFYFANGTAITPGNFSSTGGTTVQKPDITAADGVTTDVPGFAPFYGTSAAAPHAGAIAALLKSYNSALTPTQIRTLLTSTALDTMSAGVDRNAGAGIVMAQAALQADEPDLTRVTDSLNNNIIHTGDTVTVSFTLTNQPCSLFGKAVGAFHIGFYWSTNSSFTGATPFTELPVAGCAANGFVTSNQNVTISAGNAPGTYYLGYKIDDQNEVTECTENNNGIFSWTVTILPPTLPDLTRSGDSLSNLNPHPGDSLAPAITITNQSCSGGATNANAFHVGFYWSTNSSFIGAVPFLETPVAGCPANGTVILNPNIPVDPATMPGTYYLGYNIDDQNEVTECTENNNGIFYWTINVLPLPPAKAINPTPFDGATNQPVDLGLSWADGGGSASYDVYLNGQFQRNQAGTSYTPGSLMYAATYTWRIDAKNTGGTTAGDTWAFSTGLPILGVALDGDNSNVLLYWPTNAVGFSLQNETDVTVSNWTVTVPDPAIVNGQFIVTNTPSIGPMFYRLVK